jgi:hypothetical protein
MLRLNLKKNHNFFQGMSKEIFLMGCMKLFGLVEN